MTPNEGVSVLANMAAMLTDNKATKSGRTLTPLPSAPVVPVATPEAPLAGQHAVPFPYDDPQTMITALQASKKALYAIRLDLTHVEEGLNTLLSVYGVSAEPTPEESATLARQEQKAAEALADLEAARDTVIASVRPPSFAADYAAKSAKVQAAVFKDPEAVPAVNAKWECSVHHQSELRTSTRLGLSFGGCPVVGCREFERL